MQKTHSVQLGSAIIRGLCFVLFQSFFIFICREYAYKYIHTYIQPIYMLLQHVCGAQMTT